MSFTWHLNLHFRVDSLFHYCYQGLILTVNNRLCMLELHGAVTSKKSRSAVCDSSWRYMADQGFYYYSTNCNTIQIWSWCSRYLSSVGNSYLAIYVASYVGRKSEEKKCRQKDLKMLRALLSICWIIKQLSCAILRNIVWFWPTRPTASSANYRTIFRAISLNNLLNISLQCWQHSP